MSAELSDLYRSLGSVADGHELTRPESLRRFADRRARVRAAGSALAVALLVGGVAVGGRLVYPADGPASPPQPADLAGPLPTGVSPRPSPPPSPASTPPSRSPARTTPGGTPSQPTTSAPAPRPPTSIPDRAFFVLAAPNRTGMESRGDGPALPTLCGVTRFPSDSAMVERRGRYLAYKLPETPTGNVPDGSYRHTITIYRTGRADDALRELRQAVRDCPEQELSDDTRTWRQRLLASGTYGDESVLFEMRAPLPVGVGEPGTEEVRLVWAARIGDVVTVLWEQGWEHTVAERSQVDADSRRAVAAIGNWLD